MQFASHPVRQDLRLRHGVFPNIYDVAPSFRLTLVEEAANRQMTCQLSP